MIRFAADRFGQNSCGPVGRARRHRRCRDIPMLIRQRLCARTYPGCGRRLAGTLRKPCVRGSNKRGSRWGLSSLGELENANEFTNKNFPDFIVVSHEEGKESAPENGLKRRVLAYNDKLFLAEHEMVKGWVGTVHSHPHEQIVYVVQGHLKIRAKEGQSTCERATPSLCAVAWNTAHPQLKTLA